jgi:hypothetical protein
MRRAAWILGVVAILCVGTGAAQAHDWYHGHHGPYYRPYCGPVVVRPPVIVAPRVVVPVAPPPVMYAPGYPYPYYAPVPGGGLMLRGRGWSIGVGW